MADPRHKSYSGAEAAIVAALSKNPNHDGGVTAAAEDIAMQVVDGQSSSSVSSLGVDPSSQLGGGVQQQNGSNMIQMPAGVSVPGTLDLNGGGMGGAPGFSMTGLPPNIAPMGGSALSTSDPVSGGSANADDMDSGGEEHGPFGSLSLKKKRLCRYPGCIRVIKSQGHCQRHGARAKRCKVDGCDKQAQGTHDGMCKRHWKAVHFPEAPPKVETQPPAPEGESVYDSVLPLSIGYRPSAATSSSNSKPNGKNNSDDDNNSLQTDNDNNQDGGAGMMNMNPKHDPYDPPPAPEGTSVMPLVAFLKEGENKEAGWHRNAERRARGMYPVPSLSSQLEPWERQLALVEILLLSGGTPYANFKDLAHGWGRERGFHHSLASSVCERRGEVERKRRSDAGRTISLEKREVFRQKIKKSRKGGNNCSPSSSVVMANNNEDPIAAAQKAFTCGPLPNNNNNNNNMKDMPDNATTMQQMENNNVAQS